MTDEMEITVWAATTGSAAPLAQQRTGWQAPSTDIAAIADTAENRQTFAKAIAPALTLVAPVGMKPEDKRDWFAAAWRALSHLPADVIAKASHAALGKADHPSKIVPAILAAAQEDMSWRHRMRDGIQRPQPHSALPAPGDERPTEDEADAICKRYGVGRYAKTPSPIRDPAMPKPIIGGSDRPGTVPTRADYIRLGVDPAVLDRMDAERQAKAA